MRTRIPLPHPVQPLHVYRHLLRSASYFPPSMRPFLDHRIQTSFRDERERMAEREPAILTSLNPAEAREKEEDRRYKVLADAKQKIPVLQAAVEGDQARLRRVMWHVFGRLGKQRRELMASFVVKAPDPNADPAELEERAKKKAIWREIMKERAKVHPWDREYTRDEPAPWLRQHLSPMEENWDLPKLDRYLKAQKTQQRMVTGAAFPRGTIGDLDPQKKVPEQDIWGRPVALRRVTKIVRRFWKAQADKIMPPVSQADWESLEQLACGEAPPEMYRMLKRRSIAVPIGAPPLSNEFLIRRKQIASLLDNGGNELDQWQWQASAQLPVRNAERAGARKLTLLTGKRDFGPYSQASRLTLEYDVGTRGIIEQPSSTSVYSKRNLRREYQKMWQATSYMKGAESKAARPVWGRIEPKLPMATAAHRHLFEGVDAKGRMPKPELPKIEMTSNAIPNGEEAKSSGSKQIGSGSQLGTTREPRSKSPGSRKSESPRDLETTPGSFANFKFSNPRDSKPHYSRITKSSDSRRAKPDIFDVKMGGQQGRRS
ncbi:hypothetical protein CORC01_12838 [Colletotrichum orchidophilum]|uniref:LYR motif-containing protein Cup1-like N-terminal domain-containing protein n=1 Tax=Colletotrichum orchidophilum TaxID=1209926 RepID=A0A1G4ARP3_9PEZI|nr:uncharacterized protein CORC01_12838 [Colletotrichum orchidophilum]OHE91830.1 hypothetical protein CORC01_12838 [Colletotrichum orchidophilum]